MDFHLQEHGILPAMPPRIVSLPTGPDGKPVPFFAEEPELRMGVRFTSAKKWRYCHNNRCCWLCGQPLGQYVTFTVNAVATVNRTTSEPPSHLDCATWVMQAHPFLSEPKGIMQDGQKVPIGGGLAPHSTDHRGDVTCLFTVKGWSLNKHGYHLFRDPQGRALIELGKPETLSWWREGKPATRKEVECAIAAGMPILRLACDAEALVELQREAHRRLDSRLEKVLRLLPAPTPLPLIIAP